MKKSRNKWKTALFVLSLVSLVPDPAALAASKFEQLNTEAEKYYQRGNYAEAQKSFEEAIKESDKSGVKEKTVASTYYNLALCQQAQGNYLEAEQNMEKALSRMISASGASSTGVGKIYLDLGDLLGEKAELPETEGKAEIKARAAENYKKGIEVFEKIYNETSAQEESKDESQKEKPAAKDKKGSEKKSAQETAEDLAGALRLLANFYAQDEQYAQADPYYKRSLEMDEFAFGPESKEIVKQRAKVAEFYCVQGKFKEAEPLFEESVKIAEKIDPESPATANIIYNYGGMYYEQSQFGMAEAMFKKALAIFEKLANKDEIDVAVKSISLADVLDMQGKAEESEEIYKKCLEVLEHSDNKMLLIQGLKQYQKHLLMQNEKEEAAKVGARIKGLKAAPGKS